jgi:glycosyltransferase involved in cell wall biosynthesis
MILAIRIMKHDLAYEADIKDCLIYNCANPEINKIVVFSEFEVKEIKIDSMSKKISWMKVKVDHYEAMSYAAKAAKDIVIYSVPFVKFTQGLGSIREKVNSGLIFRCPDSYYIFSRYSTFDRRSSIDGILGGIFSVPPFDFDRSGYFNSGYPASSLGWKICDYQADEKRAEAISKSLKIPAAPSKKEYLPLRKAAKPSPFMASEKRVRKLDVVIVSVDYNDFLEITLERNSKLFDSITVVTSSSDKKCVEICERFGVRSLVTDCMYSDGAPFNKAKAINEGMASISDPDFILILDADVIVQDPIDLESLEDESAIYYKDRMMVEDHDSYERFCMGSRDFRVDAGILKVRSETFGPVGYFQLFKYQEKIKYIESYTDAAWSDVKFARRFRNKIKIGDPAVHLGEEKKNWYGRVTESFVPGQSISAPRIEKKKSTYTICTYYFDFRKDERQKANFVRFLSQFEGRYDNIVVGLVDYGDDGIGFDLPCRSVVIDGDPSDRRWSKEMLVNKIANSVDTDYILWIDGDLIYEDLSWLDDIDSVADGFDFVQLFNEIEYLGEEGQVLEKKKSIASSKSDDVDRLMARGRVPGGAWLGKASIIKEKSLFDQMYVGGGDTIFAYALYGIRDGYTLGRIRDFNERIYRMAIDWIDSFGEYRIGFLEQKVVHLYHGDLKERDYNGRYSLMSPTRGIMMICFGFEYERLGPHCAMSIRKFSDLPILVHTNIPDFVRSKEWEGIDGVEFMMHDMRDDENRFLKTMLSRYTSFDQTLYIDVDSSVVDAGFTGPFEMLGKFDVVSPEWKRYNVDHLRLLAKDSEKFKKFLYIAEKMGMQEETLVAGGVCFFNRNRYADDFFEDFHQMWKETGMKEDMPGLNGAMLKNRDIVGKLSNSEFNNYNSTKIVSHHNSLIEYSHMNDFTRKRYNPSRDRWEFLDQGSVDTYCKPRICFVYDIEGWAFYIISHNVKKRLDKIFEIDVCRHDIVDASRYDAIVCFSPNVMPKYADKSNIICGVSSHKSELLIMSMRSFPFVFTNDRILFDRLESDRKFYLENGVCLDFFRPSDLKKKKGNFRIGAIGSKKWSVHKGINRISKICEMLGDGFENASVFSDTSGNFMSQSDMLEYYRSIDVLVVSSVSETGPNPLLEAMACGVPVVSNMVGLAPLIIESGTDGFLIDSENSIQAYVDAIRSISENRRLYKRMSKAARSKISMWSWDIKSQEFEKMISSFLDGRI